MFYNEIELSALCVTIICDYVIFVEEEKTIYDDFNDFVSNSSLYDSNVINCYDVSLCINNGCCIQINVIKKVL